MQNSEFLSPNYSKEMVSGSISWQSPSNIALVKYWGKYGEQLPKNASISFTLSNCNTQTKLDFHKSENKEFTVQVFLDGKLAPDFKPKILSFFERVLPYLTFLKDYEFIIHTKNTFPHSSGIASSASGMSALALCLLDLEQQLIGVKYSPADFNKKASFLARLGSGSACRSIAGGLVVWGEHPRVIGSSNLFGTGLPTAVNGVFSTYQDTVLLVDKGEKVVSSTVGHGLMHNHPFTEQRFAQANQNLDKLINTLKQGDLEKFIAIVESEALSLHAMMLTSTPYFVLMKPNTLAIINAIWKYRNKTNVPVCFTLDAGANVHLLYPLANKAEVHDFINKQLAKYCKDGQFIHDQVGAGATPIE